MKIKEIIVKVGQDKIVHFFISCILMLGFYYFIKWQAIWISFGIGIGHEIFKKFTKGTPFSWVDILANALGIGFGALIMIIRNWLV